MKQTIAIRIHNRCWFNDRKSISWGGMTHAQSAEEESTSWTACPKLFEYKSQWQTDVFWHRWSRQWKCVPLSGMNGHLFPALNAAPLGCHFQNNAEVQQAVLQFLALQGTKFHSSGFCKLIAPYDMFECRQRLCEKMMPRCFLGGGGNKVCVKIKDETYFWTVPHSLCWLASHNMCTIVETCTICDMKVTFDCVFVYTSGGGGVASCDARYILDVFYQKASVASTVLYCIPLHSPRLRLSSCSCHEVLPTRPIFYFIKFNASQLGFSVNLILTKGPGPPCISMGQKFLFQS